MNIVAPDVNIKFEGFLTHAGHTYNARSKEEILQIHKDNLRMLKNIKERYIDRYPQLKISLGDTPSCSLADRFGVADEIRPGNFVFYDVTQLKIGSCDWYNIALAVKCPVVDINRHRNEAVIYGGEYIFLRIGSIVPVIVRFMGWLLKTITIIGEILFRVWNWCPCPRNMA